MNIEQKAITSIEVAEMVEKDHKDLLRDIRRYSEQLAEGKIAPGDFFTESTYLDANNQDRPCYLVTKKGCEFIANKLTGVKGAVFTAKYINRFHDLQEVAQNKTIQVPQNLIALQGMIEQMIQQEIAISEANERSQKALNTSQAIRSAIIEEYDDWRKDINHKVSGLKKAMNKDYSETWNLLYDELEKRGHCDLAKRVSNGQFRLRENGAPRTTVEAYNRLDAVANEPRLKEIFTAIVKEYAAKYAL